MSAEFNTTVQMKGTNGELLAMVMVLKKYATEMYEQYKERRNCAYLMSININSESSLTQITDEQIKDIIEKSNGVINLAASGPYGVFGLLDEVPLFENMAEAAPNAYFEGIMSGFNPGGDQARKGVLKNQKLTVYMQYPNCDYDEDEDEDVEEYVKTIKKMLPYSKFVKLFKIDKEEFEKDEYEDFIYDQMVDDEFPDMDWETFLEAVNDASEIDEDTYEDLTDKLLNAGVVCYADFDAADDEAWDEERVYDPIAKKWN